jgi:hypothetical protein
MGFIVTDVADFFSEENAIPIPPFTGWPKAFRHFG